MDIPDSDLSGLKFIWSILVLPLGWLFHRLNKLRNEVDNTKKELSDHKIHIAETHFNKDEVKAIINGTIEPIKESVNRIEASVEKLVDRDIESGSRITALECQVSELRGSVVTWNTMKRIELYLSSMAKEKNVDSAMLRAIRDENNERNK